MAEDMKRLTATYRFDSAFEPRTVQRDKEAAAAGVTVGEADMGHYYHGILDAALRRGKISRYIIIRFPITGTRRNSEENLRNVFSLVMRSYDLWDGSQRRLLPVPPVEGQGLKPILANIKAGQTGNHLVVVLADAGLKDMGIVIRDSALGRKFGPASVTDMALELHESTFNYGRIELMLALAASASDCEYLPNEFFESEKLVDLATQGADAAGNKVNKRASQLTRPFAIMHDQDTPYRCIVLPAAQGPRDGICLVARRIVNEALADPRTFGRLITNEEVEIIKGGSFNKDILIKALKKYPADNGRAWNLVNVDTSLPIEAMIKCQMVPVDLPPGIDFIVSEDNLKAEVYFRDDAGWAFCGLEPQGPKFAKVNRQTSVNHPFFYTVDEISMWVQEEADEAYNALESGQAMRHLDRVIADIIEADFGWGETSFMREMAWAAARLTMAGVDYRIDAFLVEQLGLQFPKSYFYPTKRDPKEADFEKWERSGRVTIPGARRVQVISETVAGDIASAMDDEHGGFDLEPGEARPFNVDGRYWENRTHCDFIMVSDYEFPAFCERHGGSDQDDFYEVDWVLIEDQRKLLISRNPNARGEYSVMDYHPGDWHPKDAWREVDITNAPTPIDEAMAIGEFVRWELHPNPNQAKLEAMVQRDALYEQLRESQTPVDALLSKRINPDEAAELNLMPSINDYKAGKVPFSALGHWSQVKAVSEEVMLDYLDKVADFAKDIHVPEFVETLGYNAEYGSAVGQLKEVRRRCAGHSPKEGRQITDEILGGWLDASPDEKTRHLRVMAFWRACEYIVTETEKRRTSQPLFGSCMAIGYKDVTGQLRIPVIEALRFFGIIPKDGRSKDFNFQMPVWELVPDEKGFKRLRNITQEANPYVVPAEPHPLTRHPRFEISCVTCGHTYQNVGVAGLAQWHEADGLCNRCKVSS